MKVFLLANCQNEKLYGATRMVFETIRVGFPTAKIHVWVYGWNSIETIQLCIKNRAEYQLGNLDHPEWIADRFAQELVGEEPFFLCDTDVIFWDSIEEIADWDAPLAGRYIPRFYDEFTKCNTEPRLHTSLLYANPVPLRKALTEFHARYPRTPYNPCANLFKPLHVPVINHVFNPSMTKLSERRDGMFFDGGALLYAAVGGESFGEDVLNRYDHLHCGCVSDIIAPSLSLGRNMTENNLKLIDNPTLARGIWREQERYYEHFRC